MIFAVISKRGPVLRFDRSAVEPFPVAKGFRERLHVALEDRPAAVGHAH